VILDLFERFIREGELTLIEASGASHRFGSGTPRVTWVMRKRNTLARMLRNPALQLGETYMNEGWDVTHGSLADLLTILRRNVSMRFRMHTPWGRVASLLQSWNDVAHSIANVHAHYDLDEALFRAFLDRNMHYSCAYFREPDMSLESAQIAKCNHVANKLLLDSGQRVLDIGSGWGSLAMHLAETSNVSVTGLTLSPEQLRVAAAESARRGFSDRVEFLLQDYRSHRGQYDRVVSVGMFEHVGRRNFLRYFHQLSRQLRPGGVALIHTIGSARPPSPTNPWIRRHIFPGGYIPSLSELAGSIERAGLVLGDVEVLRPHYALTLKEWNRRFQTQRAQFVASKGERFCRMWEFYLVASQTAFECGDLVVFQMQIGQDGARIPATRDYLYNGAAEALADVESGALSTGQGAP
jgi:cyclopropane-fatty-acyl-phospholipid synthase